MGIAYNSITIRARNAATSSSWPAGRPARRPAARSIRTVGMPMTLIPRNRSLRSMTRAFCAGPPRANFVNVSKRDSHCVSAVTTTRSRHSNSRIPAQVRVLQDISPWQQSLSGEIVSRNFRLYHFRQIISFSA